MDVNSDLWDYDVADRDVFEDFTRGTDFADGELYVFAVDTQGRLLASGGPAATALLGRIAARTRTAAKHFGTRSPSIGRSDSASRSTQRSVTLRSSW